MKRLRGVQLVWMRSFFIVITIIMVFILIGSLLVRYFFDEKVIAQNMTKSEFLQDSMDERFHSIPDLADKFSEQSYAGADQNAKELESLVENLNEDKAGNPMIDDILLYYADERQVVGTLGKKSIEEYYKEKYGAVDGLESWERNVLGQKQTGFSLYYYKDEAQILYASSRNASAGSSPKLFYMIDAKGIQKVLQQANKNKVFQLVALADDHGEAFAYHGEKKLLPVVSRLERQSQSGSQKIGNYLASYQPSEIDGMHYVMLNHKDDVFGDGNKITILLTVMIVCCFLVSIGIALFLSYRNAKPINQLLKRVQAQGEDAAANPYHYIDRKIGLLLRENTSALEQMESQQRLIESSFLSSILISEVREESGINGLSSMYGIEFENTYFCVIVLSCEKEEDQERYTEHAENFYQALEQKDNEQYLLLSCKVEEQYVYLLNYDAAESVSEKPVHHFTEKLSNLCSKKGINCRIMAGSIYCNSGEIVNSYAEALYLLHNTDQTVAHYSEKLRNPVKPDGGKLYADFERMMLAGEYKQAAEVLPSLFEHYIVELSPVPTKYRQFAVVNQVYDALLHECKGNEEDQEMLKECTDLLFAAKSNQELQQNLYHVLTQLRSTKTQKVEQDGSTASKTKQIIDANYTNPMLGLSSISEQLGVSAAYISRSFKKQYNQGIAEYMSRTRIKHAKELILEGKMNIKAIALSVGFSSDVSFIRVFKKYEHVTPGKFSSEIKEL